MVSAELATMERDAGCRGANVKRGSDGGVWAEWCDAHGVRAAGGPRIYDAVQLGAAGRQSRRAGLVQGQVNYVT